MRRHHTVLTLVCVLIGGINARAQQASPPPTSAEPSAESVPLSNVTPTPPQVLTVVHRLSGPKLQTWLTLNSAQTFPQFNEKFLHLKIIAGFVLPDGRSVVARLPQAEAEMINLPTEFRAAASTLKPDDLLVMRRDGAQFKANFVGLDGSTGLSLLEVDRPVLPPSHDEGEPALTIGQPIHLFAPGPAYPKDEYVIHLHMSETRGQLTEIKRAPSGKPMQLAARAEEHLTPAWTGGIAVNESGRFVGIVEQSTGLETRLISAEAVRDAAARVLTRRASVPQPWLGARGDAVATAPVDLFVARGWPREEARTLVQNHQGILLTAVAPGTPAALAGLRAGDVIARIREHDVRSIEDMSFMLKELGGSSSVNFTVLRAQCAPFNLLVRLSESLNPAQATAEAEMRAAEMQLRKAETEIRALKAQTRITEAQIRMAESEARAAEVAAQARGNSQLVVKAKARLKEAEERFAETKARMEEAMLHLTEAQAHMAEAETRAREARMLHPGLSIKPLSTVGFEAITLSSELAPRYGVQGGLLVLSIRPQSPAASSGLRAGDVIEAVNGQSISGTEWAHNFSLPGAADLSLGIVRGGQRLTLILPHQNNAK